MDADDVKSKALVYYSPGAVLHEAPDMPTIVNWRDASPAVSHDNAIVWSCLQPVDSRAPSNSLGASASVLERLDVMTVHGIQGRKESDHHKHQNREQVYYIIRGKGKAICGDARCDVSHTPLPARSGTAARA